MGQLIKRQIIDNIIKEYATSITSETTQQEMLLTIGNIIYDAINSINHEEISDIVITSIEKDLKRRGR